MNVQEAIKELKEDCETFGCCGCSHCSTHYAIKSLEMQEKLKQWIENYKNPEFKDVMITRDGLIEILEEFRLECENL